jgi:outer membrane protein OmpA-like peptidoglycan-associated protein
LHDKRTLANASADQAGDDRETTVHVSDEIMSECRLAADPSEVPRFDLDQATLRPRGRNILDDVARCMKDGPLKNRTVTVIGRADSRGSSKHNQALAGARADAARSYLLQMGVTDKKLLAISRGEQGATGDDEESRAGPPRRPRAWRPYGAHEHQPESSRQCQEAGAQGRLFLL